MPRTRTPPFLPLAGILVAAAFVAYSNTFRVPLLFDDDATLTDNPSIRHLSRIGAVLASRDSQTTVGRPVLNLSFAVNHAIGGMDLWSYHALNLAIHILAGLTLFGLVRRTLAAARRSPAERNEGGGEGEPMLIAFFVALLWTLHPLLTESVTYLSERAESLMGLSYLLTLYCFVRATESVRGSSFAGPSVDEKAATGAESGYRERRCRGWLWASWVCCLFGMGTKEVMVTAPVVVLLYDRAFASPSFREALSRRRRYYAALASTWLLLGWLMHGARLAQRGVGAGSEVPWPDYVLTAFKAVALYLRLALWPHPLVFDYGREAVARGFGPVALQAALVAVLVGTTVLLFLRGRKRLGFLAAAFFILLSPTSSVVPVSTQPIAENRMYLPLAALAVLAGLALRAALKRRAWIACGALALALGALTFVRNRAYASALSIWQDTVAKEPDSSRGRYNLGIELAKIPSRRLESIPQFEAALRLKPAFAEAHNSLGIELGRLPGRQAQAIEHFEAAVALKPDYAEAQNNLGAELEKIPERLGEAMAHCEAALRENPDFAEAHNNLGNGFLQEGRLVEAVAQFREAVRLKPGYAEAHYNLGAALARMDRPGEAVAEYREALRIDPGNEAAWYNLGLVLAGMDRMPEAVGAYESALRLRPEVPETHNNLGIALAESGRYPEAIAQFTEALRLKPDFADARSNLELARQAQGSK
jgi:tetratricopeptide (TPR) repeat protein